MMDGLHDSGDGEVLAVISVFVVEVAAWLFMMMSFIYNAWWIAPWHRNSRSGFCNFDLAV